MQSWPSKGSQCLFCAFIPRVSQQTRGFTTTTTLARQKIRGTRSTKAFRPTRSAPVSGTGSLRWRLVGHEFSAIISTALNEVKPNLNLSSPSNKKWDEFRRRAIQASKLEERGAAEKWGSLHALKADLQRAYIQSGLVGLRREIQVQFSADDTTSRFSIPHLEDQKKVADLRYPAEWYPLARAMQRTIHLHVGPTNSGKTYHALRRLERSQNGVYAGPLRLLAQEVYTRFNAEGISCGLVTGDEVRFPEGKAPRIVSNTVEMVSLSKDYDVGVIDEIQMIADSRRGWAWTRAVLGCRAQELHLCGEMRAVPLIRELVALTGDVLEIHHYERLNPLKVMDKSLEGDLRKMQKGDCLVSFSRVGIHSLKSDIEKATGRRAAIVYGSLPAEIRTQQANLFNDPNNDYDFLVASDAIGMGLNLKCKRIIFETLTKRLPAGLTRLSVPEIKQISGRAGRYRAANETGPQQQSKESNVGYVTSLEAVDLPFIQQAFNFEPPPLTAAGVIPPDIVIQHFSNYFPPNISCQYIIKRIYTLAQVHPLFFMCEPTSLLDAAEIIDKVPNLGIEDQLVFLAAPIYARDQRFQYIVQAFAKCIAHHTGGRLLDIPELNLEILESPVSGNKDYMHELEALHRAIILYLWLSYRLGGVFTDRTLAGHVKQLLEERMVRALTEFSANRKLRKDASRLRQYSLQRQVQEQKRLLAEAGGQGSQRDLRADPYEVPLDDPSSSSLDTSARGPQ